VRWLGFTLAGLALLTAAVGAFVAWQVRDRHPGYVLDLDVAPGEPAPLEAGFAALPITPEVHDTWRDRDGDARRGPDDPWEDGNGNGAFDPVWLAGFHEARPAAGLHDPLWARALVIGDGRTRIALVVLDVIGFLHDPVIDVRERIPAWAGVDYAIVASTHTHEGPDLMGLWGPGPGRSGVDAAYLARVVETAARAVSEAAASSRPAVLRFARVPDAARALVEDSRRPIVLDPGVRILHARDAATGGTLGTLVAWANHPETTWSDNLLVSSDFPHFLREAVEAELGGVAVYANGAIGGLMTTRPGFPIPDPDTGEPLTEPSFEKARAQGRALARLVLDALAGEAADGAGPHADPDGEAVGPVEVREAAVGLRARTLELPVDNRLFVAAAALGVVPRGFSRWAAVRTEVAAFTVGPASFVTVPGEIYPEIVNGGIESPPGADHPGPPVEVPPVRERMPGRFRFVLGQANDALGYVIPRTEWDAEPPWLYEPDDETYGEIVSLGPDTAPRLHAALLELLSGDPAGSLDP
jgi:hypothetical protein